jgi:hypothetical protein
MLRKLGCSMKPIVLIHGSARKVPPDPTSIANIYGTLRNACAPATKWWRVDLSRYVSLNDSVSVADIARGLNRALLDNIRLCSRADLCRHP